MDRLILVLGGVAIAALVAYLLNRGHRAVPAANTQTVPRELNRNDFSEAAKPWLVAVFTAATCNTCAKVMSHASHLASSQVAVQELEYTAQRNLHKRYKIDAVPMVLFANETGEVKRSFLGPVSAAELWSSMAQLRDSSYGSTPTDKAADATTAGNS
ncbi:MAG: hypothetical protein KTU85_04480 [Acidimicrobiia bacterium]|nr:hypothetical protein [Acidimicrobiia bacterium]MCY4457125.1 thioredoxin domain-containing protein [Acidimicrobiaceae bacterium]